MDAPPPTDREEYIAARVIHAFWIAHVARLAEYAWVTRRDLVLHPPTGVDVDVAAEELTRQLRAYGLLHAHDGDASRVDTDGAHSAPSPVL